MVKRMSVGKKNPAMTREEYQTYYLTKHSPLYLRLFPDVPQKYAVSFSVIRPGKENPFDRVTEIWYKDYEVPKKMRQTEECKNILEPDEKKLGSIAQSSWVEEFIMKPLEEKYKKNKLVKRITVGMKDPAKTKEEFKRIYLEHNIPIFLKTIPYVRKYEVNFAIDTMPDPRNPGKKFPYDFITSTYWDDIETYERFQQSDEYKNIIQPNGKKLGAQKTIPDFYEEFIMKDF